MAVETTLLEVKNLNVSFMNDKKLAKVIENVSFKVNQGEVLGFVGESGCGKSITMLSILGLVDIPPGKVEFEELVFEGESIKSFSKERLRALRGKKISMIFQDPMTSLNPVFSIGDQLAEAVLAHTKCKKTKALERSMELLGLVGIPDPKRVIESYPHQLSGGMRQRVMIAMALSCQPLLLIADEPTTALDVTIQEQLLELMSDIRNQLGMSLIWITHDLGIVAGLAEKVNVMYAGKIIESGPVFQIFDHPQNPYTIGLIDSVPRLNKPSSEKLTTINGVPPSPFNKPVGCAFEPRCRYSIEICKTEAPGLEEVEPGHFCACWVKPKISQVKKIG